LGGSVSWGLLVCIAVIALHDWIERCDDLDRGFVEEEGMHFFQGERRFSEVVLWVERLIPRGAI
jgi:hypothetical protein